MQEPAPRQTQPDVIIVQQPQQQPQQLPQQQQQPSPIQQPQYYPILPGGGQQVQQQIIPGFTGGVLQGSQIGNGPMRPDNNPQIVQQQVPTQQLTGVNGILGLLKIKIFNLNLFTQNISIYLRKRFLGFTYYI